MTSRTLGAVLLLAAASLFAAGRLFLQVSDFYPTAPSPDGVTAFESRFAGLRAMLPAQGVIGYMTEPGSTMDPTDAQAEHHLAQYALAPVIVTPAADRRYVVGNFHQVVTVGTLREKGFKLVREFGNGIALLEKETER